MTRRIDIMSSVHPNMVVRATWDDEANVWVAESPDLPGLVTEAPNLSALVIKLPGLIQDLLEDSARNGRGIQS
jgi:predicted RNase H-like HicB family nuclease